jgi:cobalt-precorrin 5A hydrolase
MTLALIAITRHGIALAGRIHAAWPDSQLHVPEKFRAEAELVAPAAVHCYTGKTAEQIPALFAAYPALIAIISLGAVVRLIAPHLKDKESDPAIVVIDEAGRFVIPVLSGHTGGANALAARLASVLEATPVLTTASDARQTLAVDLLGREFGWRIEADHDTLVRASAAMVNDAPVALVQESGRHDWWPGHANGRSGPLPANLRCFERLEDLVPEEHAAVLWITQRALSDTPGLAARLAGRCVIYRP